VKEGELIELLYEVLSLSQREDCVLFDMEEHYVVVGCDMVHERTDFPFQMAPYQRGWMSVAVSLSDIAAMGAQPLGVLVALGIPEGTPPSYVRQMAEGMRGCAAHAGTRILGGDTDQHDELTICTTGVGIVSKRYCARRRGAHVGDVVAITGTLGDAACGFALLSGKLRGDPLSDPLKAHEREGLIERALMPIPRVREGMEIARVCTSMMDTSDGLAMSLHELSAQSGVGFEIYEDMLPISEGVRACAVDILEMALYGAGDFELLFTIPERAVHVLEHTRPTVIGRVVEQGKVVLRKSDGSSIPIERRGWEHTF